MPFNDATPRSAGKTPCVSAGHAIAKQESLECEHCHGAGLTTVFAPGYTGDQVGVTRNGVRFATRVTAHCSCKLGEFIRDHTESAECSRIPRVADILEGVSRWLLADPSQELAP